MADFSSVAKVSDFARVKALPKDFLSKKKNYEPLKQFFVDIRYIFYF